MRKLLWIMLSALVVLPFTANAEVYKWKDKDGTVRYSDTAPPSDVQKLPVNGKKPTGAAPAVTAPEAASGAAPAAAIPASKAPPAAGTVDAKKKSEDSLKGEAMKRQEKAEEEKKKTEQKEAELKQKKENCTTAKTNYQTYKQGGRIHKINENGDREYLSDKDIAAGLEQAQKEMEQYCE